MTDQPRERRNYIRLRGNAVEVFGRTIRLPASRVARVGLGVAFVIGGIFSFLPVLGIWMLPVGLLILSIDFVIVRRWRRRLSVRWGRRSHPKAERHLKAARQAAQNAPAPDRAHPTAR
ncbi:hypothetical protein [Aureimonas mangrovi]|uniref:hypothetical protein n=1 Tax=Aureimonas mangrovi TaxID=2758041 RepID=UPI001FEAAE18|nr:hypothetical protein [Aureimonas mangrovi]